MDRPFEGVEQYEGLQNLEAMRHAVRYTNFQLSLIKKFKQHKDRIRDFGAGLGTFAFPLRSDDHEIVCVEPDGSMREKLKEEGFRCEASLAALESGSLDFGYTLNVSESGS